MNDHVTINSFLATILRQLEISGHLREKASFSCRKTGKQSASSSPQIGKFNAQVQIYEIFS